MKETSKAVILKKMDEKYNTSGWQWTCNLLKDHIFGLYTTFH